MQRSLRTLLIGVRVIAIAELLLGIVLWAGHPVPWRGVHIGLGVILGGLLLALGAVVARATGRSSALLVVGAWTALLIGYGVAHPRLWPGSAHWLAQALHVLIGLATLGVAERVASGSRRAAAALNRSSAR